MRRDVVEDREMAGEEGWSYIVDGTLGVNFPRCGGGGAVGISGTWDF